jgi:hypothetical protein
MVVSAATAFAQAPCASFGPAVTRLDGRLERAFAYGPPGYGETPRKDARETYLVIVLDKPLCTARGDDETDEPESVIRRVQLVYSGDTKRLLSGSRICVTGKLFHAITGHHHTKVLIGERARIGYVVDGRPDPPTKSGEAMTRWEQRRQRFSGHARAWPGHPRRQTRCG